MFYNIEQLYHNGTLKSTLTEQKLLKDIQYNIDARIYTYPVSARPPFGLKTLFIRLLLSDYFYIDLFSLLFV